MEVSAVKRPWRRSRGWTLASWLALALLGLVLAAGISLAASRLSSQHIGLSAEPLTAGEGLAPSRAELKQRPAQRPKLHHRAGHRPGSQASPPPSVPAQPAPVQPAPVQPAPVRPAPTTSPPSTQPHQDDSHHNSQDHHSGGDD
jgi:hypothetical protein